MLIGGAIFWQSSTKEQLKLNTNYGQIAKHKLPDGSEVMLNANSKLCMNKSWEGKGDREVWIEGEAYFHVKKEVVYLRIYKGLSYEEVSEIMQLNYQVVRNLLYTALKAFKKLCTLLAMLPIVFQP